MFARDTISLDMPLNISILALETGALFVDLVTGKKLKATKNQYQDPKIRRLIPDFNAN